MNNRHVGVRIARRLQSTEHAVDKAMVETSALIQTMIEGRRDAGLAAEVGHLALLDMVRGLNRLAEARSAVIDGHQALADVASAQGVRWSLEGPLEEKTRPFVIGAMVRAA
ncbi:hypothetical protein [uncultured Brevundimonas sp.]|uniref:hypothetical protein n=1 Tax=uncultured Brevundimonas sp. TaxID=213418 RepID=UPI0030EB3C93|tara:strand:- start:3931 stop:4263 length:333 start_codon:yes stop_codon:yes gene_type:complete